MKPRALDGFGQGGPVGVARYETLLRRLFGVKGTVAPTLARNVSPSIDVDGQAPEYGWLRGEMHAAVGVSVAPVAGQFSLLSFYPGTQVPGTLYVIHQLTLQSGTAVGVRMRIDARLAGGLVSNVSTVRDARWVPTVPSLTAYSANNAANQITQDFVAVQLVANTVLHLPVSWVLSGGGQSLNFEADAVNTNLRVNLFYTERPLENSEL